MDSVINNSNDRVLSGDDKWGKDGPNEGCLMTAVKFGGLTVLTAAAVYVSLNVVVPAVEALWR